MAWRPPGIEMLLDKVDDALVFFLSFAADLHRFAEGKMDGA